LIRRIIKIVRFQQQRQQQQTTNNVNEDDISNNDAENEINGEIESLITAINWKDILEKNLSQILRLTHDDFVNMIHKYFDMR
jgi:hypothetical protein